MNDKNKNNSPHDNTARQTDQSRRDFLKKSKYAAYATPLVTGLIIKKAAATASDGFPDSTTSGFSE